VVFDKGDIALAMRASMAVPAIFAAVEVDGVTLVDGGIADNLPIDVVRKMGADTLLSHLLPLPPGEGWGEGIKSSQLPDFLSPHPVLLGNCSMLCVHSWSYCTFSKCK